MGEIFITNKLTANYDLMGFNSNIIDVMITVGTYIDNQIEIDIETRAQSTSSKVISIEVVYSSINEIGVVISPSVINNIPIEIEVNPHNKMSVYYELATPPTVTIESFPVQDSFVIQRSPYSNVNYGKNNSMIVGVDQKGKNLAFVKFDTSIVPIDVTLKSAKVRFYYSQLSAEGLGIFRVNGNWSEYGITYSNMPTDLSELNKQYSVNESDRYIEFDVTFTVSNWIKGLDNYGFALKADSGVSVFGTREFPLSPELIIEYYSPLPFSNDLSNKKVEIIVARLDNSNIKVELDVKSNFDFSYLPIEIFTKQKDEIFNVEIPIEIEIPEYKENSNIHVEISVMMDGTSGVNVEIEVPIFEEYLDVAVEIEVQSLKYEHTDIRVDIDVSEFIVVSSDIEVNIEISEFALDHNDVEVSIEVPEIKTNNVDVEVVIDVINQDVNYSDIEVMIEVALYETSSDIAVVVECLNMRYEDSNIPVELEVNLSGDVSDITVSIECFNFEFEYSNIAVELEINSYEEFNNIEVEIEVYDMSYSEMSVNIECINNIVNNKDIAVELNVPLTSNSSISVYIEVSQYNSRSTIGIEIEVPIRLVDNDIPIVIGVLGWSNSNIEVDIHCRVGYVEDITVEIEVNSSNRYAYVFMF